jgi:hypothetical protein
MKLLLFFIGSCIAMAMFSLRRDELPRTRSVAVLIVIVSLGYLTRRMI